MFSDFLLSCAHQIVAKDFTKLFSANVCVDSLWPDMHTTHELKKCLSFRNIFDFYRMQ